MARYLDPKNDLVFKKIFGQEPELMKSFLNALMPLKEGQQIESLSYLSPENIPDNPLKKFSIVDVMCKDNFGRKFIVEMQMQWSSVFPNKMLMNVSRTFSRQIDRGKDYGEIQPVYGLGILNESFDKKTPEYYHHYQMSNSKNTEEVIEGIEIVMVELPKIKPETTAEKRMAVLWLRFLNEIQEELRDIPEELSSNKYIRKALEICEVSSFNDNEIEAYERYWMDISTEVSLLNSRFRDGLAEGEVKGFAEGEVKGFAEGEAKGLAEGEAKGRAEGQKETSISIAINMLKAGMAMEDIVKLTGLTSEEISKLN